MINPDMAYRMAKADHQARIDAAERRRVVREARATQETRRSSWLAAAANRLRRARRATESVANAPLAVRHSGQPTPA